MQKEKRDKLPIVSSFGRKFADQLLCRIHLLLLKDSRHLGLSGSTFQGIGRSAGYRIHASDGISEPETALAAIQTVSKLCAIRLVPWPGETATLGQYYMPCMPGVLRTKRCNRGTD